MKKNDLESEFSKNSVKFIERWKKFLSFESISTDAAHESDCRDCALWLSNELQSIGLKSRLLETTSKPVVFGEFEGPPGSPTVVFYGHYDVQPVDPVEEWTSPPFEATLKNNRIYARGAEDNKGQVAYVIAALETLIENRALKCSLKLFIEGEEESGSSGIAASLEKWSDILKGDLLMVCDTGTVPSGAPTITMGLRGMIHCTVRLGGIGYDLHSGVHGGAVANPADQLARIISKLHNEDGSIAVPGFLDSVAEATVQDLALADAGMPDAETYKNFVGVYPEGGESNRSVAERVGFRPTIEINGFHSGYGGPGSKTIIPSFAEAKISCRLVPNQDPATCLAALVKYIEEVAPPPSLKLEIIEPAVGGGAVTISASSPWIGKAKLVLDQLSELPTVFRWEGASIPIVAELSRISNTVPILVGFGSEEDRIHAPNESFGIEQFRRGFLWASMFIGSLDLK